MSCRCELEGLIVYAVKREDGKKSLIVAAEDSHSAERVARNTDIDGQWYRWIAVQLIVGEP